MRSAGIVVVVIVVVLQMVLQAEADLESITETTTPWPTTTTTPTTPYPSTGTTCPPTFECSGPYCRLEIISGCPMCLCYDPYCFLANPCPPGVQCISITERPFYYCAYDTTQLPTATTPTPCPTINDCTGDCFLDYSSGICPNCVCEEATYCELANPCPPNAQCISTDESYYCAFDTTQLPTATTPTPCPTINDCTGDCFLDYSSGICPNCVCEEATYCEIAEPCPFGVQCVDINESPYYHCTFETTTLAPTTILMTTETTPETTTPTTTETITETSIKTTTSCPTLDCVSWGGAGCMEFDYNNEGCPYCACP